MPRFIVPTYKNAAYKVYIVPIFSKICFYIIKEICVPLLANL